MNRPETETWFYLYISCAAGLFSPLTSATVLVCDTFRQCVYWHLWLWCRFWPVYTENQENHKQCYNVFLPLPPLHNKIRHRLTRFGYRNQRSKLKHTYNSNRNLNDHTNRTADNKMCQCWYLYLTQKLLHEQQLCSVLFCWFSKNLNVIMWDLEHANEESYKNGSLKTKPKIWKFAHESKPTGVYLNSESSHINCSFILETRLLLISPHIPSFFCKPKVWQ